MKPQDSTPKSLVCIGNPSSLTDKADDLYRINKAKYSKAGLLEVASSSKVLTTAQQPKLLQLLQTFEPLFDGTLEEWKKTEYHINLKEDATPFHTKPIAVPGAYKSAFRKEVNHLCQIGILKKVNCSEWAAPTFLVPTWTKPSDSSTISAKLTSRSKRSHFPF